jgi:glycosyltransferase involved in cell wall biosynthesis
MNEIYITSAPFQTEKTGDYEYLKIFKNTYNNVINNSIIKEIQCDNLKEYYENEFTKNVHDKVLFKEAYERVKKNLTRMKEVDKILKIVKNKVLIIEYRAPETGCLFYPEDIETYKKNNIKIVIVCHEFYINTLRPYLKDMTVKILNKADITFFFNYIDYNEARKRGFKGKYFLTRVMPLIEVSQKIFIPTLEREENILFFGLIRPNKGFLNALMLGKMLENNNDKKKVIIAGKCELSNILIDKWLSKIGIDIIDKNLKVNNKYKNNLEIYFNPDDNIVIQLANRCQYAYKSDGKGFSYNSSSLINTINLGCILITKSTIFTPKILLDKQSKYYGSIIFQEKISTNILTNKIPDPEYAYNIIQNMTYNQKKNIINKMTLLLNDFFDKKKIILTFYHNLILL